MVSPIFICHHIKLPNAALLAVLNGTGLMLFERRALAQVDTLSLVLFEVLAIR